jgi:hypothetical protein
MISALQPVGINEEKTEPLSFAIYPSINHGQFSVNAQGKSGTLEVIDVQGRILYTGKVENEREFQLDLKPGCYYLKLSDERTLGVKKMIVE